MKRVWTFVGLGLVVAAIVVPLSSRRPDPVQTVLGLSGGVESTPEAILGILLVFGGALVVAYILSKRKRPPRS